MKGTTWQGVLGCVVLAAMAGCTSSEGDEDETGSIVIGAVVDQSGAAGPGTWAPAAELAASQMNAALAEAGSATRFRLVVSDSTNVPDVAVKRAEDLVRSEGAVGLVLDTSQDALAVVGLQYDDDDSKHLNVPMASLVATSPLFGNPEAEHPDPVAQEAFRDPDGWHFRTSMSSAPQGIVLTRILQELGGDVNEDGTLKVSAFVSDEPFGLGQLGAFSAALAEEVPDAVVEGILFDPAEHSPNDLGYFAEAMAQLSDDHNETTDEDDGEPDFLLGLTFPDYLAAIITAYAQSDSDIKFVHGMALRNQKIIDSVGSDANGHEGCAPVVVDPGRSGEIFAKDIESVTDMPPNSMDAATYDAAATLMLAALIATQGESDPAAVTGKQVRNAMPDTSDLSGEVVRPGVSGLTKAVGLIQDGEPINYEGAQGPCDFDEHGSVRQQYVHFVIDDRQFVDQDLYDCVSDLSCPVL